MNLFDVVGGRQEIDNNAATQGVNVGQRLGGLSSQAGPAAFALDVIKAKQAEDTRRAALAVEQQKARAAGLQKILLEGSQAEEGTEARKAFDALSKNPIALQIAGIDPSKNASASGTDWLDALRGKGNGGGFATGTKANVKTPFGSVSVPLNREFNKGEAELIGSSKEIISTIDNVISNLGIGTELFRNISGGPFRKKAQSMNNDLLYLENTLLQLKSGAAVSQQEYDRWSKLIRPKLSSAKSVDIANLERFKREFSSKLNAIMNGQAGMDGEQTYQSEGSDDFEILEVSNA